MINSTFRSILRLLLLSFGLFTLSANASADDELLDVNQAFQLATPEVKSGEIHLHWTIAKDYHLYKQRVSISSNDLKLAPPTFSAAVTKDDAVFGKTEVFLNKLDIQQPFEATKLSKATITVKYQGCADKLGVCYPPQTRQISIDIPAASSSNSPNSLGSLNDMLADSNDDGGLLPADKAFAFSSHQDNNGNLILTFKVANGYHLYQDKIKASVLNGPAQLGTLVLPKAEPSNDPVFGDTLVYKTDFEAKLPISNLTANSTVQITYQGCSDLAGVCYPPEKKQVSLSASSANATTASPATSNSTAPISETDQITQTLQHSSVWIVVGTFFLFGLLLSLTPCVFPMIPILSSIIVGQGDSLTTRKAFIMSLVYVLAMSVTYTVAGVLAGLFGENLQVMFQNPWIIGSFALIFVLLSFSMFGFYELQLPSALQSKITNLSNKQQGGTLTGVAIMGFLSALIVGPCVAPPLAGALIYIGQTGDALLGGTALFAMSIGMGVPLLLLGTSAGKLLPKAGMWMENVKAVFGVLMLGVAIWMAARILPDTVTMVLWATLLIGSAIYLGALEPIGEKSGWSKLAKSIGFILLTYGVILFIGLAGGSKDALQPLKVYQGGAGGSSAAAEQHLAFKKITTLDELKAEVAKGKPVMLDFYADWCVSCKEMEKFTFSDPGIMQQLKGVTLLQVDVTANNENDKALMKAFGIIGPPAILFFKDGQEARQSRVIGFQKPEQFSKNIQASFN
ncbi:protein-disulfide reductase DsbD [Hydrogenovibrio sp. JE_KL2]|uniref:protein-disulfide reductase DsbD n=1 Tax=Hydrogenovibrio sp. JE_KL2 TaxID=2651188 RepID=UPI00128DF333|nr:protein-disulfide reductase DsbD [Hydrogenovibrio sp. JE_KL2]MPQ76760.1 protein-disulfide reductase DsbD [Hydrogenovibrio sp. JE_KL2]